MERVERGVGYGGGFCQKKKSSGNLYIALLLFCVTVGNEQRIYCSGKKKRRAMKGEEAPTNRTKWKGCHASAVTGCRYTLGAGQSHFALIATRL